MWSYMIAGYALNGKDEDVFYFTFLMVLLICANIMDYYQGKQVHILTIKYGFDSYDFVGIYLVGMFAKYGFVSSFVHSFWASCQNSHELTVQSYTVNVFNGMVVSFSLIMATFWSLKPECSIANCFYLLRVRPGN